MLVPGPKETIEIIYRLKQLHFDDDEDAFWRLHHWRLKARRARLEAFRGYIGEFSSYQLDGDNHRVHQRLSYVLDECHGGSYPPQRTFADLADEAFHKIPPK
jgi:hypothetical protein